MKNNFVYLFTLIASTAYWTDLLKYEKGPFNIGQLFQEKLLYRSVVDNFGYEINEQRNNFFVSMFKCYKCFSTWVALGLMIVTFPVKWVLYLFTASYLSSKVNDLLRSNESP